MRPFSPLNHLHISTISITTFPTSIFHPPFLSPHTNPSISLTPTHHHRHYSHRPPSDAVTPTSHRHYSHRPPSSLVSLRFRTTTRSDFYIYLSSISSMPGTIHVSVLELVGLPSPQQSSSMFIKVSMGKQAHEMRDKEETSFPLMTLRDNLNVSIQDAEGNEVAHTSVETRSIVQKVMWDDLFPLKGGGNIHMRLQFILTEDEQNRIRSMRESATRIKHEDLLKRRHSSTDTAGASGGSPESSHDSFKSQYKTEGRSVEFSGSQANKISAESNVKSLNKAQPDQEFSTSKSTGSPKLLAFQHSNGRFEGQSAEQQNQLDKTPSNAFESSPVKLTDTDIVLSKSQEKSNNSNEWESSRRRPSNISFPGPAWQAVKIAIVVGFGLLVLLTRQKK